MIARHGGRFVGTQKEDKIPNYGNKMKPKSIKDIYIYICMYIYMYIYTVELRSKGFYGSGLIVPID